jgi:hypothetical protein
MGKILMTKDSAKQVLSEAYGLSVKVWVGQDEFEDTFSTWTFDDARGNRYKIVHYDGDFPRKEELVQWMKDADLFSVKEYAFVEPSNPQKEYFLYRLMPHSIGGAPTWNA